MLAYLSKKIAIPNQVRLHSISWNRDQGWIACGGDDGLLKVLKLDNTNAEKVKGGPNASNLSMNQTLEGHSGAVICLAWNPHYRKLTSSDENGMIIVWMLHKGMWYEEMINNRNKSVVKDMKWTSDGKKICIIYEDGAVIVGSVDGNRIWGKELSLTLRLVEWSPDSRSIMFASGDLDLILYDSDGSKIKNMALSVSEADARSELVVAAVHWYNGIGNRSASLIPSLCIAFSNGTVQLSRGEWDPKSIIFDAEMEIRSCKWSPGGTVLALMGTTTTTRGDATRTINVLKFYDPMGVFMRYIRIPGESVASFAWEGDGLRIALAVDAFVFFSNIRPVYKWAYLENTVVYSFYKPERRETALVFWDLHGSDFHIKYIPNLKILLAAGGICAVVLVDRGGEEETSVHSIQLRNSVGAVVDSRTLPIGFNPICANICATHVVLASTRTVYVWQFSSSSSGGVDMPVTSLPGRAHQSRERMFDVETASMSIAQSPELFKMNREEIDDAISCVAISEKYLVVARQGGYIQRYTQPHLSTENVYIMRSEPYRIELSCSSSRLGCIDSVGIFTVIDLEARVTGEEEKEDAKFVAGEQFGRRLTIEKRDVWDMRWSSDNEESIAVMEKDKLVIYCGEEAEEPIVSYGYLARFEKLQVRSVFLDDIYSSIEQMPPQRERVIDFETRGIREVRDVIASEGLEGAYRFAASRPHPKLWKLLAETALSEGDLNVAEKSFVKAEDYFGVQFVKQLRSMPDKMKMRAEIAVYLNRFDEAESIYIEIDRRDLAVELRSRLGDFSRVVPLLHNLDGSDKQLGDTYDQVGEYFADRFKWRNAAHYFGLAHNNSRLADSLYRSENFDGLRQLSIELTEGSPLLAGIAAKFESIGMATEAVECYLKAGNPKAAVDCCVTQNRWDRALELAEEYSFPQVDGLLNKHAAGLIARGKQLEAVELFRRANRPTEAALLIGEIAELAARSEVKPGLAKKLHVLAALEIERHRKKTLEQATMATLNNTGGTLAQATAATLDTLMMTAMPTQGMGNTTLAGVTGNKRASKGGGGAWRGAAAYHFYMLAQRQLYSGALDSAMKSAIKLCEYDDILEPRDIYAILVLASMANNFFGICSKAFVKLETLQEMPDEDRDQIQTLAVRIFSRHTPSDPAILAEPYMKCLDMGKPYKACLVTGRAVLESAATMCLTCRHVLLDHERGTLKHCPLCHHVLPAVES